MDNMIVRKSEKLFGGREYVVKGTDGWNLVTNNPKIARQEAKKTRREFGKGIYR